MNILQKICTNSTNVHIAFHTKPTNEKKDEIRKIFLNHTEEAPLPKHESSSDRYIYSQVYNSLYELYSDSDKLTNFFDSQVSTVDEMVDIIIEKTISTNEREEDNQYLMRLLEIQRVEDENILEDNWKIKKVYPFLRNKIHEAKNSCTEESILRLSKYLRSYQRYIENYLQVEWEKTYARIKDINFEHEVCQGLLTDLENKFREIKNKN